MKTIQNTVENPNTAIGSETESEATPTASPSKKRKRRKHDKKFIPNFDIPGVSKLILNEETQNAIGCIAGDNVTTEKPWINIGKDIIQENIELHSQSSEFLPLKEEIFAFQGEEILMGYIPDETRDFDEFYICITEEATEQVNKIVEKLRHIQEERLKNAINKKIKSWKSLGSELEVDENMIKTNRTLIEVEIESKYPILPFKVHFRQIRAQDLRDGYMELRPSEETSTIYRKRIDTYVQVAPSKKSNEVQTVCTYPKNSCTQYEYKIPENFAPTEECVKIFEDYIEKNMDSFCDILRVNGTIDLYSNDYENLIRNPKFSFKVSLLVYLPYIDFIDMDLCKGKMVSSLSWHPMWSGCVVLSYVDIAPPLYIDSRAATDEVLKAVHDTNPVLFWSFTDDLKPKLILETYRPVQVVSFCPYDENLIIGGCSNGQIILWDITNKLNRVEEEEILTVNQQHYRKHMHSLMNWMKDIFDLALLRPTAISDLKYSHKGSVNAIQWMSPFHSVTKTGKIEELDEEEKSLQFVTSGEGGYIMVWDLLKKPTVAPGGFKAVRKLRRLKKRPSALLVDESPYKLLHLNLKPIYRINIAHPMQNLRLLGISSFLANFFQTTYERAMTGSRKNLKLNDRLFFKPVLEMYKSNSERNFYVGTMEGDFIQATWEGQEFDAGEVVNWENCQIVCCGKYHDGPVVSIDYSHATKSVVTVGGKTFAVWRDDFPSRPILWRKSSSIYTAGNWFQFEQSTLKLIRIDGYVEMWTLFHRSKSPLQVSLSSNGPINIISTHPRKINKNVFGICDYRGSFHVYYTNYHNPLVVKHKEENMSSFLTSEIERKKAFLQWQEDWNKRHSSLIEMQKSQEKIALIEENLKSAKKERKKIKEISAGERHLEIIQDQHRTSEQARIKKVILQKKQLNTEELLKQREPLNKFEQENEVKKRKQKGKHKEADRIFKDTVAMLFPDVIKKKPIPPHNPYEDYYPTETKREALNNYQNLAIEAQDYVDEHPFSHDFNWKAVVILGRERRKRLDGSIDLISHRKRYATIKEQKARAAAAQSAERLARVTSKVSKVSVSQESQEA